MRIAEIYSSIQGEGEFIGTRSVFLRTTGCNLRCWFCDTPFTSWAPEGNHIEVAILVKTVSDFGIEHVVITGGEPLLPAEIEELTRQLKINGHFITIETAGTLFRNVYADLVSISPKLSNSSPTTQANLNWQIRHDRDRHRPDVVRRLIAQGRYQLKFVVDHAADLTEVLEYLEDVPEIDRSRVWLMPQAISQQELTSKTDWLEPLAASHGLRFSSRLHIEEFGNVRGK